MTAFQWVLYVSTVAAYITGLWTFVVKLNRARDESQSWELAAIQAESEATAWRDSSEHYLRLADARLTKLQDLGVEP